MGRQRQPGIGGQHRHARELATNVAGNATRESAGNTAREWSGKPRRESAGNPTPDRHATPGEEPSLNVAYLTGPQRLHIGTKDEPRLDQPGHVLVRIDRVGICGSDVHSFEGMQANIHPRPAGPRNRASRPASGLRVSGSIPRSPPPPLNCPGRRCPGAAGLPRKAGGPPVLPKETSPTRSTPSGYWPPPGPAPGWRGARWAPPFPPASWCRS